MKKYLIFIILLFGLNTIYSQTYFPFPVSHTEWDITFRQNGTPTDYYSYILPGNDTVINNKSYHNLIRPFWLGYDSLKIGGLREDSLKRIFFYDYNSNYEFKLYDFSKTVGDTIQYGSFEGTEYGYIYDYLTITEIDSVFITDSYRRRFFTNAANLNSTDYSTLYAGHEVWIEGIGSYRELLSPIIRNYVCLCSWQLNWMIMDDSIYYEPPLLPLSISEWSSPSSRALKTTPNPTSGALTLKLPLQFGNIKSLEIYNCLGQLQDPRELRTDIDLTTYENGLYFLVVTNDKGERLSARVVKE